MSSLLGTGSSLKPSKRSWMESFQSSGMQAGIGVKWLPPVSNNDSMTHYNAEFKISTKMELKSLYYDMINVFYTL